MSHLRVLFLTLILTLFLPVSAQKSPKREFRGVWIHTLNNEYKGMNETRFREYLTNQLDLFRQAGINAVLFQVRPEADALYKSSYEPWSRFLTGTQGKDPGYDPMAIVIEECHRRNMEFHAWINPYRAQLNLSTQLGAEHPYNTHPEWFFKYDNKLFFNPGLPECRKYINDIVTDIVTRYDVDGIHMDDYFYPYPVSGQEIPDQAAFAEHGAPSGFDIGDWRRYNVNLLIQELQETIHKEKPYVKFGISPFGIYRNRKSNPEGFGSETNGLQNYDQLYADVLLWLRYGWVDYIIPQLYWEIGHKAADYETLVKWWANCSYNRPLFIGQDVDRSAKASDLQNPNTNQFPRKMQLSRAFPTIGGNCFWSGKVLLENPGNIYTALERNYQRYPALPPVYPATSSKAAKIKGLKPIWTEDGYMLVWKAPKLKKASDQVRFYCIYRFTKDERVNLDDPSKLIATTQNIYYKLPYDDGSSAYKYVVTAVDRFNNESSPKSKTVKL